MPSGKQVLIDFLSRLALSDPSDCNATETTEELRACLLLRASTADETWPKVNAIRWATDKEDGEVIRHGAALGESGPFLSDLLETIIDTDDTPRHVREAYPGLSQEEYGNATDCIWFIFSSLQWFKELSSVENDDIAERNKMVEALRAMLESYREDPEAFLGRNDA